MPRRRLTYRENLQFHGLPLGPIWWLLQPPAVSVPVGIQPQGIGNRELLVPGPELQLGWQRDPGVEHYLFNPAEVYLAKRASTV